MGQQSILHAVRTPKRKTQTENKSDTIEELNESMESGGKPLNETLSDLPLDESFSEKDISTGSGFRDLKNILKFWKINKIEVAKFECNWITLEGSKFQNNVKEPSE